MIHSPLSLLLVAILAAYLLHALWQMARARDGVGAAALVAAYLTVGALVRLARPEQPVSPLLAPFVYPYAWLGMAALFWLPAAMRPAKDGLHLRYGTPAPAATLLSALCLHVGVMTLAPLTDAGSLAMYLLLPSLMALQAWLVEFFLRRALARSPDARVGWLPLAALTLAPVALSLVLARILVPILLRHY